MPPLVRHATRSADDDGLPMPPMPVDRYGAAAAVLERRRRGRQRRPQRRLPALPRLQAPGQDRRGPRRPPQDRQARRQRHPPDGPAVAGRGATSPRPRASSPAPGRWTRRPTSICYNLLLTQLTLGKLEPCLDLIPQADRAARHAARRRAGSRRRAALLADPRRAAPRRPTPTRCPIDNVLADMTPADEKRLLDVVRSLGQLDTTHSLLKTLSRGPAAQRRRARGLRRERPGQGQGPARPLPVDRGRTAPAADGRASAASAGPTRSRC